MAVSTAYGHRLTAQFRGRSHDYHHHHSGRGGVESAPDPYNNDNYDDSYDNYYNNNNGEHHSGYYEDHHHHHHHHAHDDRYYYHDDHHHHHYYNDRYDDRYNRRRSALDTDYINDILLRLLQLLEQFEVASIVSIQEQIMNDMSLLCDEFEDIQQDRRVRDHDDLPGMYVRIMSLCFVLLAQRCVVLEEAPLHVEQERQARWIEDKLTLTLLLGDRLYRSASNQSNWLHEGVVMQACGALRGMRRRYASRVRITCMLDMLLDILLFRDVRSIEDKGLRMSVHRLRRHMMPNRNQGQNQEQEQEQEQGECGAARLCALVVDGILTHDSQSTLVSPIIDKMRAAGVPMNPQLVMSVLNKDVAMSPAEKWGLLLEASQRHGVPISSFMLHRVLMACVDHRDRATAESVVSKVQESGEPIEDVGLVVSILSTTSKLADPAGGSMYDVYKLWDTMPIPDEVKWHGCVLSELLISAMAGRRHALWKGLVREILRQSDEYFDGSWPTPFFDTTIKRDVFVKNTVNIIRSLLRWGEKDQDQEQTALARKWESFIDNHLRLYAAQARPSSALEAWK